MMRIIIHPSVEKFLKNLDDNFAAEVLSVIELLEKYGRALSMPHAKPIGSSLWELRISGKHASRILYGFHKKDIILLVAIKKKRTSLMRRDIATAEKRFDEYCNL